MDSWLELLLQAGGAITVCGFFLYFMSRKQSEDNKSREALMVHLVNIGKQYQQQINSIITSHQDQIDKMVTSNQDQIDKIIASHQEQVGNLMRYLKDRDAQSKDIASSGHESLRENTSAISNLSSKVEKLF